MLYFNEYVVFQSVFKTFVFKSYKMAKAIVSYYNCKSNSFAAGNALAPSNAFTSSIKRLKK